MNKDKKLRFLLGFAATVLFLSILSSISSLMLLALYAAVAVMLAVTAITAIKATEIAAETAITGKLATREKTTIVGRVAATGIMFVGIGVAALGILAAVEMGAIGIFAIPMLTALYLYNIEKEKTIVNHNIGETIENDNSPTMNSVEVMKKIVNSALTDVDEKLLCSVGNSVYEWYNNRRNENLHCTVNFSKA